MSNTTGINNNITGQITPNGVGRITASILASVLTSITAWIALYYAPLNAPTFTGIINQAYTSNPPITASGFGASLNENAPYSANSVVTSIFGNYTGYDGLSVVADLPPNSTVFQSNGVGAYCRARAGNLSLAIGGFCVGYFGTSTAEGQGSAVWAMNYGLGDDYTPGTYTSPTATVTISVAAPAVVTWTAHGLAANAPVYFSATGGTLPTGINALSSYYVVGSSITANTFQISLTPGGTAIATTVAATGVITAENGPRREEVALEPDFYVYHPDTLVIGVQLAPANSTTVKPNSALGFIVSPGPTGNFWWSDAFVSQDGAASYALIAGAQAGSGASYSQYVGFSYRAAGTADSTVTLVSDTLGNLQLGGGNFEIMQQPGTTAYSNYLKLVAENAGSAVPGTLNLSPLGAFTFSGAVIIATGSSFAVGSSGGLTQTCTVNQAKTLIFTGGILTGGTCNS